VLECLPLIFAHVLCSCPTISLSFCLCSYRRVHSERRRENRLMPSLMVCAKFYSITILLRIIPCVSACFLPPVCIYDFSLLSLSSKSTLSCLFEIPALPFARIKKIMRVDEVSAWFSRFKVFCRICWCERYTLKPFFPGKCFRNFFG
jgi:hypothetical protein